MLFSERELITTSSSIELIDQKSASTTHGAVTLSIRLWSESRRYLLLIYRVSFALRCCLVVTLGFQFTVDAVMQESIVLFSTRTMSSSRNSCSLSHLLMSFLFKDTGTYILTLSDIA